MIFDWFKRNKHQELNLEYEYSEKPVYDYEEGHRETMAIIHDIQEKLDEIKVLIDEMKNDNTSNTKDV